MEENEYVDKKIAQLQRRIEMEKRHRDRFDERIEKLNQEIQELQEKK